DSYAKVGQILHTETGGFPKLALPGGVARLRSNHKGMFKMKKANMMISTLSTAILLSITSGYSSAEGICKGMEKSSCATSTSCRWVKGYERSDGRSISGYCRKLPGKKPQSTADNGTNRKG
ncbi:hypothetical protein, partial [Thiolapillus sp.]